MQKGTHELNNVQKKRDVHIEEHVNVFQRGIVSHRTK